MILLNEEKFEKFASGKSRPYSLFVIADARKFRRTRNLDLESRIEAFGKVAKAFSMTHAGQPTEGRVFFARVVWEDSREVFQKLKISGLPYLAHLPPNLHVKSGGEIQLKEADVMPTGPHMDWMVMDLGAFVQERTGLSPGDLSAAGAAGRSRWLPVVTLLLACGLGFVGWKLYQAPFMRWMPLYATGIMFLYWFSVSGGMYNIIRGVPFVGYNRNTRQAMLFISGSGQVGAEGFIMGSMYVLCGLTVAAFVRILPTVKDENTRRSVGYGLIVVLLLLFNIVTGNHVWKTGLITHFYF